MKLKAHSWKKETKLINFKSDSSRKRGRGLKSMTLEMKKKLQQTPEKCKRS